MTFVDTYRTSLHLAIDSIDSRKVGEAIEWFREEARDYRQTHFRLRERRQRFHCLSLCLRHR